MKTICWWCVITLFMALSVLTPRHEALAEDSQPRPWGASMARTEPNADSFSSQSSVLRMVGGLFLCFGVLGLGVHVYKKYVLPRALSSQRRIQVVERIQLSQKCQLVLVKLDGKEFLMTTGSESTRLVPLQPRSPEFFEEALTSACHDAGEYNA